ncbi:unnamed protein product [Plutella xylostella]|uniref:(diamondback moth) hypothetical protein n=1 Tax=Plutella xylostella TaxID=51655 RepID=A0A8S4FXN6_PLUXY|nr:unnamed protein product [Plutella xylostella]
MDLPIITPRADGFKEKKWRNWIIMNNNMKEIKPVACDISTMSPRARSKSISHCLEIVPTCAVSLSPEVTNETHCTFHSQIDKFWPVSLRAWAAQAPAWRLPPRGGESSRLPQAEDDTRARYLFLFRTSL